MDPCPSGRVEEAEAGKLLHQLPARARVHLCPLHFTLHCMKNEFTNTQIRSRYYLLKASKDFLLGQSPKSFTAATKLRHLPSPYLLVYTPASLVYFLLCFAFSLWNLLFLKFAVVSFEPTSQTHPLPHLVKPDWSIVAQLKRMFPDTKAPFTWPSSTLLIKM